MKSKLLVLSLTMVLGVSVLAGCAKQATAPTPTVDPSKPAATTPAKTDATTSASVTDSTATFAKAVSKDGTWIIAATKDLTFDKDVVIEGEFKKDDKVSRKLALYNQKVDDKGAYVLDEKGKKITDKEFTITAPKVIVKSENMNFKEGVIKSDVYVDAKGFNTSSVTIEGNLYFASQELKDAFKLDDASKVTGKIEVKALAKAN